MEVTRMLRPLSILAALGMVLAGLALVTDRPVNALAPPEIFCPIMPRVWTRWRGLKLPTGLACRAR